MTIEQLQDENARLKAEVEQLELKATNLYNAMKIKMEADEVVRKSRAIILQKQANDEAFNFIIKKLEAEVERLRMAGDAMAEAMWYGDAERSIWVKKFAESDWNAAKEGKQP